MSGHHCHANDCRRSCPPEYLMCPRHWRQVPRCLQAKVWDTYRLGQCDDKSPSEAWHQAADAAIGAVALREGRSISQKQREALKALYPLMLSAREGMP